MKKIWVGISEWDENIVYTSINGGVDALVVPDGYFKKIYKMGDITVVSKDGDLIPGIDVKFFTLLSSEQISELVDLSENCIVILECKNWKIIPIENIISKRGKNIILSVSNLNEALTVFSILEKGVLGVYVKIVNFLDLEAFLSEFLGFNRKINLKSGVVELIKDVGVGDRVCLDTCSILDYGEGVLVGNSSTFFFLIHAENIENLYIPKRSFRINVGAVHSYVLAGKTETRYLSEMSSGDGLSVVDYKGNMKESFVGRVKIEKRPLCLLRVVCDGYVGTVILQKAETIRLVLENGTSKSILKVIPGDEILVFIGEGARHFGCKIEEFISEK